MPNRILIVEDEEYLLELLSKKMRDVGFDVLFDKTGSDTLKIISEKKPSVVLLDVVLPGISGFDLLSKIRKNKKIKDTCVIILSNLGQKSEIDKGLKSGADGYIVKTAVSLDEIANKVLDLCIKK